MKLIHMVVNECRECPFSSLRDSGCGEFYVLRCTHDDAIMDEISRAKNLGKVSFVIPNWCPLDTVPKEYEELAQSGGSRK